MSLKTIISKAISILSLTLCLCLFASASIAATYYVDKNNSKASDSNPGTESSPFKTFQRGVDVAIAGDTVYVKAGTYYEYVRGKNSGKAGAPITFKSYGDNVVTINGSNHTEYRVVYFQLNDYIVWDGIDVVFGSQTGGWFKGNHNTILNSKFHDNGVINSTGHTGLNIIDSDYTTIKYCEFYNNGWNGMNVQSSSNSTIEYNIAHHNIEHFGIQLYQNKAETGKMWKNNNMRYNVMYNNNNGMYLVHQEDNEVSNNLIFNNYGAGIILATNDIGSYAGRTMFYNNTISNNYTYGISNQSATQLIIKNNIITGNGSNGIKDYQNSSNHVIDNNLYYNNGSIGPESNPLTGNPFFNDVLNNDYSLKSGSPAIDAGADLSGAITRDIEGTPRPLNGVFDIGAYEYGSEIKTISAPQNLRIQ